jgi:hypothetical protein
MVLRVWLKRGYEFAMPVNFKFAPVIHMMHIIDHFKYVFFIVPGNFDRKPIHDGLTADAAFGFRILGWWFIVHGINPRTVHFAQ